ncbi:MAG: hypothetical protein Q4E22_03040 [Coriobacteriia bacterium]|nr:hypothetical protein [Coriobacteriia bacterium]
MMLEIIIMKKGERIQVGDFILECLWPEALVQGRDNAESLVLLAQYKTREDEQIDILLMGDAEKDELASILASYELKDLEILKLGHHGSKNSITSDELSALSPQIAVISCGYQNRYGHPDEAIVDMLLEHESEIVRTDIMGDICFSFKHDEIAIKTRK